jgi:hypothetical protein
MESLPNWAQPILRGALLSCQSGSSSPKERRWANQKKLYERPFWNSESIGMEIRKSRSVSNGVVKNRNSKAH